MTENLAGQGRPLPVGTIGYRASGWWGAGFFILSEASLFAYWFFTYFYFAVQPMAQWVPGGDRQASPTRHCSRRSFS
jgi:heme/copper-type cytochrome/quinol oxidase subunit 3